MLNLYFFNSPEFSSVGFSRASWTLSGNSFIETDPDSLNKEVWSALLEGVAEASCFDSCAGTRIFMMRNIRVQRKEKRSWSINFIAETDEESFKDWSGLAALFILRYKESAEQLADLLTVNMTGGEHYVLDGEGMFRMIRSAVDEDLASNIAKESGLECLDPLMNGSLPIRPRTMRMLVPYVNLNYYYQYTSLEHMSSPKNVISKARWHAALNHMPLSEEGEADAEETKSGRFGLGGIPDDTLMTAGIVIGVALMGTLIFGAVHNSRSRERRRSKKEK